MTDILTTQAAAPITANDLVPGAVFMFKEAPLFVLGWHEGGLGLTNTLLQHGPLQQGFVRTSGLSEDGNIINSSWVVSKLVHRLRRPTSVDKPKIAEIIKKAKAVMTERQKLLDRIEATLQPYV